jgi:2,3-bisphosphoglycerate-independent phosphoglycerate mutase
MNRLWASFPHTTLQAAGEAVGLPEGQMGNSEVGHLNLGAGMVVVQESLRIDRAIADGTFFANEVLISAMRRARARGSDLHLMGILGPGGVHGYSRHLYALLEQVKKEGLETDRVFLHLFLDGRDTLPTSGLGFLRELEGRIRAVGIGQVATLSGRYYAMDRDQRWERTKRAYQALVMGAGEKASSPQEALAAYYRDGTGDEFVPPTVIAQGGRTRVTMKDGDCAIFANFRADRARQLTWALSAPNFSGFQREAFPAELYLVTMTHYDDDLRVPAAFLPHDVEYPMARVLSEAGIAQFHTAETEKYAHVTYFVNGGREDPFPGEDRVLVPSPKVATYDLQPEMSCGEVTGVVLEKLEAGRHPVIIVNYANPDMVGHTGMMGAAVKAIEAVDRCLGQVARAVLAKGGAVLITADHGNADQMRDYATGRPFTAHTVNLVPFILVGDHTLFGGRFPSLRKGGILADVAPTILALLRIPPPQAMTGRALFASGQGREYG